MSNMKREEREVSLFRDGRTQAVRIPKEFEMDADEAVMWKDPDGTIHIRPKGKKMTPAEVIRLLRAQPPVNEDWPEVEELPLGPVDLGSDP